MIEPTEQYDREPDRERRIAALNALPVFQRPHLRLFLSADIVGSTAFKQTLCQTDGTRWKSFAAVLAFYQDAEQILHEEWQQCMKDKPAADLARGGVFGAPPELWKTMGDEVLFTKLIEHPKQIGYCLQAWITTLEKLRVDLRKKYKLDVKSTVWVADFPIRNTEVILRHGPDDGIVANNDDHYLVNNYRFLEVFYDKSNPSKQLLREFVGPSIDIGFRLGTLATARKLMLSVELAYILSNEQVGHADDGVGDGGQLSAPFRYDGRQVLKGVLNGNPYPIIWLDLDPTNSLYQAEDVVLKTPSPTSLEIQRLCGAFIESEAPCLKFPYIRSDFPAYSDMSEEELALLLMKAEKFLKLKQRYPK